jgi:hypothetical protein
VRLYQRQGYAITDVETIGDRRVVNMTKSLGGIENDGTAHG